MSDDHTIDTEQDVIGEQLDTLAARIEDLRRQTEGTDGTESSNKETKQGSGEQTHGSGSSSGEDEQITDTVDADHDVSDSEDHPLDQSRRYQRNISNTASDSIDQLSPDKTEATAVVTREPSREEAHTTATDTEDTAVEADTTAQGNRATGAEDPGQASTYTDAELSIDELNSLVSAIDQFIETIGLFKSQISTFEERINSNTGDIDVLQNTSVDITEQMNNLVELIDAQNTELSEIQRKFTQYREAAAEYEQNVDELQADVQDNRTTISDIREDNLTFREDIAGVRNEVLDIRQDIDSLEQRLETIETDIDDLHEQDTRLTSQVETLGEETEELATDIADIESDISSLRNRTVTVDGEDLLLRAAIRELSRRQLSTEEVTSIANQQVTEEIERVEQQLTDVQTVVEELAAQEDTRMNIAAEISSLQRDVQSLKEDAEPDTPEEDSALAEPGQSDLRENVRELQRENRAIKELIEGLNRNGQ